LRDESLAAESRVRISENRINQRFPGGDFPMTIHRRFIRCCALALVIACSSPAVSRIEAAPVDDSQVSSSTWPALTVRAESGPRRFVTEHRGEFNGKKVSYRATVAETIV